MGAGTVDVPPAYRVLLCDLRSDRLLDILPAHDVKMGSWIGKSGTMSCTIPVPNAALAARVARAVVPGRTAVWVERGGDIWWGGILWTGTLDSDERGLLSVGLQAGGWETYLDHRLLYDSFTATAVDQFDIVRGLFDYVQDMPGGDLGITYDTGTSGVVRDRAYSRYDLPTIRQLVDDLAACDNGFEWRIASYRDVDGRRTKRLRLGHPVLRAGSTDVVLDRPGPLLSYSLPTDATEQANVWQSRGATINSNQAEASYPLMSQLYHVTYGDQAAWDVGWPRLDGTSDYTTVETASVLDGHAVADLLRDAEPVTIPEIVARPGGQVSPHLIGGTVRLRIQDLWHADGADVRYRVIGMEITPPERGRAEQARLYLEEPQ